MNSPKLIRPMSAERPNSARSIDGSTRQQLRHPNARHIKTTENNDKTELSNQLAPDLTSPNATLKYLVFRPLDRNLIEVAIRCIFLRMGDIDTLNERFNAEILLEASWEEVALQGYPKRKFDPSKYWTPELELMNGIGELHDEITYTVYYDKNGNATVTEHHKLKGVLWERMELQHFPVDVQDLSLVITTSRTNREMKFVKNLRQPSGVNRRVFMDEQEWYLFEHVDIHITEQIDEYLDEGNNHSVVICSCHVARRYGYFIWNAYFLVFLITSASFTTFPIPLANINGRLLIGSTLLLTSITFRWLCNKSLPTISYLTAVDVYAIGSLFSLCLLNIYHGVIGYVNHYIAEIGSNTTTSAISDPNIIVIDRWALVIFTIIFFVYQIATIIWMYLVPWRRRQMMFKKDQENRLRLASTYNDSRATFREVLRTAKLILKQRREISVTSNDELQIEKQEEQS